VKACPACPAWPCSHAHLKNYLRVQKKSDTETDADPHALNQPTCTDVPDSTRAPPPALSTHTAPAPAPALLPRPAPLSAPPSHHPLAASLRRQLCRTSAHSLASSSPGFKVLKVRWLHSNASATAAGSRAGVFAPWSERERGWSRHAAASSEPREGQTTESPSDGRGVTAPSAIQRVLTPKSAAIRNPQPSTGFGLPSRPSSYPLLHLSRQ
jgi:hypothetical protein